MKVTEFFSPPDGDLIANPDLKFLKILLLYVDGEYWNSGSGDSYIKFNDGNKSTRLEILFLKELGFYLRYKAMGKDFHSVGKGDYSEVVRVFVGGDPIALPAIFFVDRKKAFEAVKVFLETGDCTLELGWEEHSKVKWDWDKYL